MGGALAVSLAWLLFVSLPTLLFRRFGCWWRVCLLVVWLCWGSSGVPGPLVGLWGCVVCVVFVFACGLLVCGGSPGFGLAGVGCCLFLWGVGVGPRCGDAM